MIKKDIFDLEPNFFMSVYYANGELYNEYFFSLENAISMAERYWNLSAVEEIFVEDFDSMHAPVFWRSIYSEPCYWLPVRDSAYKRGSVHK